MPITFAAAGTQLQDTSNTTSYATASWTPTAARLALLAISSASGTDAVVPSSVSGNGLTWDQVQTAQRADLQRRVTIYRAWVSSVTAGAITITFGASQQGCLAQLSLWNGVAGAADNGASAIVQAVALDWASTNNPSITLAAFADAGNGTYGALSHGATPSAGSGFTSLFVGTHASPTNNMITEGRADNATSVDVSAGSGQGCGVALEIAAFVASVDRAGRGPRAVQNVPAQFAARW